MHHPLALAVARRGLQLGRVFQRYHPWASPCSLGAVARGLDLCVRAKAGKHPSACWDPYTNDTNRLVGRVADTQEAYFAVLAEAERAAEVCHAIAVDHTDLDTLWSDARLTNDCIPLVVDMWLVELHGCV
jgi:hypothetical protein